MITWQDIVLAVCIAAFNVALLPSVFGKSKPQLSTSVLTFSFLIPQAAVFLSLSLWYSFTMSAINACLWAALGIQKAKSRTRVHINRPS